MHGSQLKRLKASLREQGVIGPQQSKKQKRRNTQDGSNNVKRLQKAAALDGIREQFNPFDFKHNVRGPKFQVTSNRPATGNAARGINGRPGDAKAAGEERRRQTLLVEMNRRHKVGGIFDRRFGENDPTMTPEEKMLQRFVREKQGYKRNYVFDLEEEDPGEGLTHMGKSLSLNETEVVDDFDEEDLSITDDADVDDGLHGLKRSRSDNPDAEDDDVEGQPERKKSKQEVMKEVIAKSKIYKAERQALKDADEDMREELDKELPDLQALLYNKSIYDSRKEPVLPASGMDSRERMERDYDLRLKLLAQDRRAQATERTKTDEEKAQEEVKKLREVEEIRMKRMRGEKDTDDEAESDGNETQLDHDLGVHKIDLLEVGDDSDAFGLGTGIRTRPAAAELGFEDEDDFIVEEDLVASGSDLEPIESDDSLDDEAASVSDSADDDEFIKGLIDEVESTDVTLSSRIDGAQKRIDDTPFECPQSLADLIDITQASHVDEVPSVVQRIRILYHPKIDSSNKQNMQVFASKVLPQYLRYLSNTQQAIAFRVLESLIRHLHSLAKTYALEIANEFREQIVEMNRSRELSPDVGDLVCLTAIGIIFPTSDHFHQVTTPAMLSIARYLGSKVPKRLADYVTGVYLGTLALQYQSISKRWVPELMNLCWNILISLAPANLTRRGPIPTHEPPPGIRISNASHVIVRGLSMKDCIADQLSADEELSTKIATMTTTLKLLEAAAELFNGKASFFESFGPITPILAHLTARSCAAELPAALIDQIRKLHSKLEKLFRIARMARRPLELHHHQPLAIKTFVPKFEDTFDPKKHYDPDRDRAELAKLKAEHKREHKGALRELRKDANFEAREKLRKKKAADAAYEKKYKRLVAEIQGEEGKEANTYEREKSMRKRAAKR